MQGELEPENLEQDLQHEALDRLTIGTSRWRLFGRSAGSTLDIWWINYTLNTHLDLDLQVNWDLQKGLDIAVEECPGR